MAREHRVTDEMVQAYGDAWASAPAEKAGDRRRAGLEAALAVMPPSEVEREARRLIEWYREVGQPIELAHPLSPLATALGMTA